MICNLPTILSLFKSLESAVGHKHHYGSLDPFPCQFMRDGKLDIIAVQSAAKRIATHTGLSHLIFVVAVSEQEPNVAGHIELNYRGSEVFIEISHEVTRYNDAVLATLSHEIAHKFLHGNDLKNGDTALEQEILTDLTAVYLGMGKIMLNGCECGSSSWISSGGRRTTTTHTLRTGYLSRADFALAYKAISEMRKIPRKQMMQGLSDDAAQALRDCEDRYSAIFGGLQPPGTGDVQEPLYARIETIQKQLAGDERVIRRAQRRLSDMDDAFRKVHVLLADARSSVGFSGSNQAPVGVLNRLSVSAALEEIERVCKALVEESRENVAILCSIDLAEDSEHEIVVCPRDRTKLRVPVDRSLLVTCPSCKYRFVVETFQRVETSWKAKWKDRIKKPFSS